MAVAERVISRSEKWGESCCGAVLACGVVLSFMDALFVECVIPDGDTSPPPVFGGVGKVTLFRSSGRPWRI